MMNIQQFMQSAIQSTEQVLHDKYSIDIQLVQNTVTKINDQKLYGLRVVADAGVPTPTIHLNNSFELYKKGFPFDRLVQQISMMLLQAMQQMPPAGEVLPYCESMDKRALSIRVLETARNHEYLKEHPYMELGNGFSAICDRMKSDGVGGFWRSAVTHEMMQADHLDAADLLSCALHNAARIDPPVMMSMEKVIALAKAGIHSSTVGIHAVPGAQSYILTNKSQGYGASALFYPGTAKTILVKATMHCPVRCMNLSSFPAQNSRQMWRISNRPSSPATGTPSLPKKSFPTACCISIKTLRHCKQLPETRWAMAA